MKFRLKEVPVCADKEFEMIRITDTVRDFVAESGVRDGVVFTNRRIFAINVQGVIGKKKDFTILPYKRIQAFSIETAGVFDMDSELQLWFSGLGQVTFEFSSNANVTEICRLISENML